MAEAWLGPMLAMVIWLSGSAAAQSSAFDGKVAYVTPRGQLGVVDPAAGEPRLVSPIGPRYQFPAFSPGGDAIAAIAIDGGEAVIDVFDSEGSTRVYASASEPPIYLSWAPRGDVLSFIANDAESGIGWWVTPRDGDARRVVGGQPFYWDWDPDGSAAVAHTGLTGEGARLAFVDPDRGFASNDLAPPGIFQAPAIAPSREWIAYGTIAPGPETRVEVVTYPRFAGEVFERSFAHQGFVAFGWNPVADVLAVVSPEAPAQTWFGPLRLLDADDGFLELAIEEVVLAFFWSPDGRKLAYLTTAPTGGTRQVAQRVQDTSPRLRLRIAYIEGTTVTQTDTIATFRPPATFLGQFLPFFDQYARSHRVWSPASDALVFPALGVGGGSEVVLFGIDGSQRVLADGDMPFWNVR